MQTIYLYFCNSLALGFLLQTSSHAKPLLDVSLPLHSFTDFAVNAKS